LVFVAGTFTLLGIVLLLPGCEDESTPASPVVSNQSGGNESARLLAQIDSGQKDPKASLIAEMSSGLGRLTARCTETESDITNRAAAAWKILNEESGIEASMSQILSGFLTVVVAKPDSMTCAELFTGYVITAKANRRP